MLIPLPAISLPWERNGTSPLELINIVAGGRLSTGVKKKGWLLGGEEPSENVNEKGDMRIFCFEWAAM
jgi:hypothetical protein